MRKTDGTDVVFHPNMGKRIGYLFAKLKLPKKGAYLACGYEPDAGMISHVIRGETGMERDKFNKLCEYLGVDPDGFEFTFYFDDEEFEVVFDCVQIIKNRDKIEHFTAIRALIKQELAKLPKNVKP